jgi:universal stress protein A
MSHYKTILVAVDLTAEAHKVAKRALTLAQESSGSLHVVHVIEPSSYVYGADGMVAYPDVEMEREKQALSQLKKFSAHYDIPQTRLHLENGKAADAIHELAAKLKADLVVVGSHGRSGIALLLGSTANSVLHGSKCDVLAVRVGKE